MFKNMNDVRIIGGKWRGKKLPIPEVRPTPDRVRVTLFNWLNPHLHGANCLDLFAGTGVLGIEALSRGASSLTMVDENKKVIANLQKQLIALKALNSVTLYQAKVPEGLKLPDKPFDIVFIDPPYESDLLFLSVHTLENKHFLADSSYIYLETNRVIQQSELPVNWTLLKAEKAGQVGYHLVKREKLNETFKT